jgi:hypothetical protein
MFAASTYQKLLKRIPSGFKLCDASLGTTFFEELSDLASDEKKKFEEIYGKREDAVSEKSETEQTEKEAAAVKDNLSDEEIEQSTVEKPAARRAATAAPKTGLSADKIALIQHWDKLTDKEKSQIKDVSAHSDGKIKSITYTDDAVAALACDAVLDDGSTCGVMVPTDFLHCPSCGCKYEVV